MAALPPGPAQPSSHCSSRPSRGAFARAIATSWLPSSWTPARPVRTAVERAGLTALGEPHGVRRPAPRQRRLLADLVQDDVRGRPARPRHERHLGPLVVGLQQVLDPRTAAAERVPQRRDDPSRMRMHHGEMVLGVLVVRAARPSPPTRRGRPAPPCGARRSRTWRARRPARPAPAPRWPRRPRAWGSACRAAGGRPCSARREPAGRPPAAAGRCRRRRSRRTCPAGAASRRPAPWRAPRPGRRSRPSRGPCAAAAGARGSHTRRARPRPAAPRRRG